MNDCIVNDVISSVLLKPTCSSPIAEHQRHFSRSRRRGLSIANYYYLPSIFGYFFGYSRRPRIDPCHTWNSCDSFLLRTARLCLQLSTYPHPQGGVWSGANLGNPEVKRCGDFKTDSTHVAVPSEISWVAFMPLHRKQSPVSKGDWARIQHYTGVAILESGFEVSSLVF